MQKLETQELIYFIGSAPELGKALQKTEFSELFVFVSFGIVRISKLGNFSEISGLFELPKIQQK